MREFVRHIDYPGYEFEVIERRTIGTTKTKIMFITLSPRLADRDTIFEDAVSLNDLGPAHHQKALDYYWNLQMSVPEDVYFTIVQADEFTEAIRSEFEQVIDQLQKEIK